MVLQFKNTLLILPTLQSLISKHNVFLNVLAIFQQEVYYQPTFN